MQLTIEIPNQPLYDKILWFLDKFREDGVKIISNNNKKNNPISKDSNKGLDFSSFPIESFKNIDGLEYQKKIRDEW